MDFDINGGGVIVEIIVEICLGSVILVFCDNKIEEVVVVFKDGEKSKVKEEC